jgi:hypothetical protein
MYGLERIGPVREFIREVSGYIPDFSAAEETGVLPLAGRDGRVYGVAATVCFDNAHLSPYTDPVRDRAVDLHLVVSNEAWYEKSFEVDQMVAFTRIAALASGRAIVRATNSGSASSWAPTAASSGASPPGGKDRMVQGRSRRLRAGPGAGAGKAPPIAVAAALPGRRLGAPARPFRAASGGAGGSGGNPAAPSG